MEKKITWLESLGEGLKQAREGKKAVFLDFFNPG